MDLYSFHFDAVVTGFLSKVGIVLAFSGIGPSNSFLRRSFCHKGGYSVCRGNTSALHLQSQAAGDLFLDLQASYMLYINRYSKCNRNEGMSLTLNSEDVMK